MRQFGDDRVETPAPVGEHVRHATIRDIDVAVTEGPLLQTFDVTGAGLDGAKPLPAPGAPGPVPAPAAPYVLS